MLKKVHIFGGGTVEHIANHLALTAPAYGRTAKQLEDIWGPYNGIATWLHLTKMAGGNYLETFDDIRNELERIVADPFTKIIFFSCAIVDFKPEFLTLKPNGAIGDHYIYNDFGKHVRRIKSDTPEVTLDLIPQEKLLHTIRQNRKDIFLVGFKTTCGATEQEMFIAGLTQCKKASVNLVLVNDTKTYMNMIVTPEEAAYCVTDNRTQVLEELVNMTWHRSQLTFTQSTVIEGKPVDWYDERIPSSLRKIVNYCIEKGAYKVFNGSTVGHFAVKLSDTEFLTSIRRSNFNDLAKTGMVYVRTDGPDTVLAYGAKPSVGGQSQRIVFKDHPGFDCILHFHCEMKKDALDDIPVRSQKLVECGSHQCGKNTSDGLKQFGNLKAVMLEHHGPNIVFPSSIDQQEVIDFIDRNFDLDTKTGGYHL